MARKKAGIGLLILGLGAIAVVYFLTRKKGTSGTLPSSGPAVVSGTVGIVKVAQLAQNLPKEYGSLIRIDGVWNGTTSLKSAPGVSIPWPYRVTARLGHSVFGAWKPANELGMGPGESATEYISAKGPSSFTKYFYTPSDPDQVWDIHVMLEAQADENQDGVPDGATSWKVLYEDKHDGAIVSKAPPPVGAVVSGTLGITTVAQSLSRDPFGLHRR